MKTVVVSYSLTGNNNALAASIASELSAEHVKITELKPRTMGTIALNVLFNRTPKVNLPEAGINDYDFVILAGPVWMGQAASPLRSHLKKLNAFSGKYAFVSISGGADGPNPKLEQELIKRTGKNPAAVIDLHIAGILPAEPKPQRKDTSKYILKEEDVKKLTDTALAELKKCAV
ncbi:MAG: hypothetical protein JW982_01535 [Spirochaetes bacterium]|nr:hypothetical protein [Spirochaetota bacterium]